MRRDSYFSLNGSWQVGIGKEGSIRYRGNILVPFPPESRASGVELRVEADEVLFYEKSFTLPEGFVKDRVLLHFGACDQYARVYLNGRLLGEHAGGYLPFTFDISEYITAGENLLSVEARDPLDKELPYGKQTFKRGGMWYTNVSGIWQTVWLESVCKSYVSALKIRTDMDGLTLEVEGGDEEKLFICEGEEHRFSGNRFRFEPKRVRLWSPEAPELYEFTLICGEDKVESYFGLRSVGIGERRGKKLTLLNGRPYFFHGVLDQGYFSDGIFLPASEKAYADDILKLKSMGFNMLRKHIKLEPEVFYYYCDRYGIAVFQDMINNGGYSFFIDTALPTVFLKRGVKHRISPRGRREFELCSAEIIKRTANHPSVMYYTIFNEGWGQYGADRCYRLLKPLAPELLFDSASGWFWEKDSDVVSHHVYFKRIRLKPQKKPLVLSEYGGYSLRVEGHVYNLKGNYGYGSCKDGKKLTERLVSVFEEELLPAVENGLCAAVLTQLSDVEDETNGLLSYDRRACKPDCDALRQASEKLMGRFSELYG